MNSRLGALIVLLALVASAGIAQVAMPGAPFAGSPVTGLTAGSATATFLRIDGTNDMTGPLTVDTTNTTCGQPLALEMENDPDTGIQRTAANTFQLCSNGTSALQLSPTSVLTPLPLYSYTSSTNAIVQAQSNGNNPAAVTAYSVAGSAAYSILNTYSDSAANTLEILSWSTSWGGGGTLFGVATADTSQIRSNGHAALLIGTQNVAPIIFGTGNGAGTSRRATIDAATGFFGIGPENPDVFLDVQGNASFNGFLYNDSVSGLTCNGVNNYLGLCVNDTLSIGGTTTITGDILPAADTLYDLGAIATGWEDAWIETVSVSGAAPQIRGEGAAANDGLAISDGIVALYANAAVVAAAIVGAFVPEGDGLIDLGSATAAWDDFFVDGIVSNPNGLNVTFDNNLVPAVGEGPSLGNSTTDWNTLYANFWANADASFVTVSELSLNVDGGGTTGGSVAATAATTGTATFVRLGGWRNTTAPSKPACAAAGNTGVMAYLDDTDDATAADVCVCRMDGAGAFAWVSTLNNSSITGLPLACAY